MRYVWDEGKRQTNLQKHGLDFADVAKVFSGPLYLFEDLRAAYGEQRMVAFGILHTLTVVVVHVEANDTVRVISMRRATRNESNIYFRNI